MRNRFGSIWFLSFWLVTVLFVYSLIIYGFDINVAKEGRKHALVAMVANSESHERFYKVDDEFGFLLDDRFDDTMAVFTAGSYERSYFPFCLTCGWYTFDQGFYIHDPHLKGTLLYSTEPNEQSWGNENIPNGAFETYDMETHETAYVESLDEIDPNAASSEFIVRKSYVESNFEEISFSGGDDGDCIGMFIAVYAVYFLLLVWALISLLIRWIRIKASEKTVH